MIFGDYESAEIVENTEDVSQTCRGKHIREVDDKHVPRRRCYEVIDGKSTTYTKETAALAFDL